MFSQRYIVSITSEDGSSKIVQVVARGYLDAERAAGKKNGDKRKFVVRRA